MVRVRLHSLNPKWGRIIIILYMRYLHSTEHCRKPQLSTVRKFREHTRGGPPPPPPPPAITSQPMFSLAFSALVLIPAQAVILSGCVSAPLAARSRPVHMSCSIRLFRADGVRTIEAQQGELLRTALLRKGATPHNEGARLINCRGLGTCGTCAVEIDGAVEPEAQSEIERLRLSLPPHSGACKLRLACQCTVQGDLLVRKMDGFWGQGVKLAPERNDGAPLKSQPWPIHESNST